MGFLGGGLATGLTAFSAPEEEERKRQAMSVMQPRAAMQPRPPALPDASMNALPEAPPMSGMMQPRPLPAPPPAVLADPANKLNTRAMLPRTPENMYMPSAGPDTRNYLEQGNDAISQRAAMTPRPTPMSPGEQNLARPMGINSEAIASQRSAPSPLLAPLAQARQDIGPQQHRGVLRTIGDVALGLAGGGVGGAILGGFKGGDWRYQHQLGQRAEEIGQQQAYDRQRQLDEQGATYKQIQENNITEDNRRMRDDLERRRLADNAKATNATDNTAIKARTLTLKEKIENAKIGIQKAKLFVDTGQPLPDELADAIDYPRGQPITKQSYKTILDQLTGQTITSNNKTGDITVRQPAETGITPNSQVPARSRSSGGTGGRTGGGNRGRVAGQSPDTNKYTDRASELRRSMGEYPTHANGQPMSAFEIDSKIRAELKRENLKPSNKPYVQQSAQQAQPIPANDSRKKEVLQHLNNAQARLAQAKDPQERQQLESLIQRLEAYK